MGDEAAVHAHKHFLVPNPIPTRRTRTSSQSEEASKEPVETGYIQSFCREKGHGFVIPTGGTAEDHLFIHISDIDCDYVPKPGDKVRYKKCRIPPKFEKFQAVHVEILEPVAGTKHERWDQPSPTSSPRS